MTVQKPHPLQAIVNDGEAQKKRLSHVEVKVTKDLLSEVRKESIKVKRSSLKHVEPVSKQQLLSDVRTITKGENSLKHVGAGPVDKQQLLSSVRTEAATKRESLKHVEAKSISGLMSEVRKHNE